MAKKSMSGKLRLRRLVRLNKALSLSLDKKQQKDLDDYIQYQAEESRFEMMLNHLDNDRI